MAADAIPEDVKAFIAAHIESVLQLEILLQLHAQAQRQWTSDDVARELRIDPVWAANQLAGLANAGVLAATASNPPAYRYEPRSPALDHAVQGLAREYADRRVTVIGLIFSKPLDKIRSFADAFRIRRDKTDG